LRRSASICARASVRCSPSSCTLHSSREATSLVESRPR
jgi:hypothetical protein